MVCGAQCSSVPLENQQQLCKCHIDSIILQAVSESQRININYISSLWHCTGGKEKLKIILFSLGILFILFSLFIRLLYIPVAYTELAQRYPKEKFGIERKICFMWLSEVFDPWLIWVGVDLPTSWSREKTPKNCLITSCISELSGFSIMLFHLPSDNLLFHASFLILIWRDAFFILSFQYFFFIYFISLIFFLSFKMIFIKHTW